MTSPHQPRPERRFRLPAMLAGLIAAFGLTSTPAAQAQSVAPSAAPIEWVRYAETATTSITGWLESDDEAATRFRAYLHQTRPAEDQSTPPLVLKVWIEKDGRVTRVEFTPFAHEQANTDLRAAIVGRSLPSAPPKDMLLPMLLAVQLDPLPPKPQTQSGTHNGAGLAGSRTIALTTAGPAMGDHLQ